MTDDEVAIRDLVQTWMEATRRGDLDNVLSLIADDAIFMAPGREPFGKAEFRAASEGISGFEIIGRSDLKEIGVLGDWAWIRNHLELTVKPPGGEPTNRAGYALSILRKDPDGRWRLFRDANLVA